MDKRSFYFINPDDGTLCAELHSKTPREAALKAATYDVCKTLLIVEVGKLHIFEGKKIDLPEEKQNEFTRARNITSKPYVKKMTTEPIDTDMDIRKNIPYIVETYKNL